MKTIVFIVGAGHSGSTVLDMALGSSPNAFSLGEIVFLGREVKNNTPCVCGKQILRCPFWSDVNEMIKKNYHIDFMKDADSFSLMTAQHHDRKTFAKKFRNLLLILDREDHLSPLYLKHTEILYDAVFKVSNKDVLIDSSKNLRRALMLNAYMKKYRVLYIHLIRDCRGVAHSYKKDTYSVRFPGAEKKVTFPSKSVPPDESVFNWIKCNLMISLDLSVFVPFTQWKIVRYEDFTNKPDEIFSDLAKWIGLSDVQRMIHFGSAEHHNVSGNSSRFNSSEILPAYRNWKKSLSQEEIGLIKKKAGLINRLYGFKD